MLRRTTTNLQFTDDTDANTEEEQKLWVLTDNLDKISAQYTIEINTEKPKLMTDSANDIVKIKVD